jgi:hypothetical protein
MDLLDNCKAIVTAVVVHCCCIVDLVVRDLDRDQHQVEQHQIHNLDLYHEVDFY